jgi:glycosyltransferase involved in cell wall biosynthesis
MISASVVVCTRNRWPLLEACLASLALQTYAGLETVVVDNGSTDETPAKLEAWRRAGERRVVVAEPAAGLSRSRNRGLQVAHGDVVLFLDDDALAPAAWVAAHAALL